MAGYFRSRNMFDIVPLVFGGFIIQMPFVMHFLLAAITSYLLSVYFSIIYGENRRASSFILVILFFGSWFLSNIVFGKPVEDNN